MPAPTTQTTASRVLEVPAASVSEARDHFLDKLRFETDPSDVYTDIKNGVTDFVVLDPRGAESFAKEHIPGALNLHYRLMDESTTSKLPKNKLIIVYCAGVHCNASTKGALRLAQLGFRVKEMLHGLEGWKAEGYTTEGSGVPATLTTRTSRN